MTNPNRHPLYQNPASHQKTDKLYQRAGAADLFTAEALVTEFEQIVGGFAILLNRTVAHPKGGGQPADKAQITIPSSQGPDSVFTVDKIYFSSHGGMWHCISSEADPREWDGRKVIVAVDPEFRRACRAYHTAGHLIHPTVGQEIKRRTVHNVRKFQRATGTDGFGTCIYTNVDHTPGAAFIEFLGNVRPGTKDQWAANLEASINEVIRKDCQVGIDTNNNSRSVTINRSTEPCEGTHVNRISEIMKFTISDVKPGSVVEVEVEGQKFPTTRISYKVS